MQYTYRRRNLLRELAVEGPRLIIAADSPTFPQRREREGVIEEVNKSFGVRVTGGGLQIRPCRVCRVGHGVVSFREQRRQCRHDGVLREAPWSLSGRRKALRPCHARGVLRAGFACGWMSLRDRCIYGTR